MEKKKQDLYDKMKQMAEKTEDFIEDQVEKLKKRGTLDKINEYADKTEEYIEKKVEEFKNSDIPDKVDEWVEKTEQKASEVIKKAGEMGDRVSQKMEDFVDDIKTRVKKKPKETEQNSTDLSESVK